MAHRVFITGDTHGPLEIGRLNKTFAVGRTLDKDDYLIVLGDFGLVWADRSECNYWLRWLEKKPFTTLFVDGNHENFDMLDSMDVQPWHGGMVHRVNDSVLHLMRGHVFDIAGRSFFCMGGARSVDRIWRTPGKSWWPQEMPSVEERAAAWEALEARGWKVDYVLTHCAASNVQYRLNPTYENDDLTRFLFDIEKRLEYRHWFFGHYHEDRAIDERQTVVFKDVIEIVSSDGGDGLRRVWDSAES
ncbi:MAG: metallophosphoesterase [Slackia sp.]|nr:metallophosphoesterase [Slackia sp.]